MVFVETPLFAKARARLMNGDGETYRALQSALLDDPTAGDVIPKGASLRKLRWGVPGRGKRGGLRVIYRFRPERKQFPMVFVYDKAETGDLTPGQLSKLAALDL
jgi:hypothetical protein